MTAFAGMTHPRRGSPFRGIRAIGGGAFARRGGGFSLIEVLIAVLVLGLGLLGLGAVFPVVVRQQRVASDAVLGLSTERSIASALRGHGELNAGRPGRGWRIWRDQYTSWSVNGEWMLPNVGASNTTLDRLTGDVVVGSGPNEVEIVVAERLTPRPSPGINVLPRFVWDFVGRRVPGTNSIQLAVFVRRIDPGIRVPPGVSLFEAVTTGQPGSAGLAVPVAVDSAGNPTLRGVDENGVRNYAVPLTIRAVDFIPDPLGGFRADHVVLSGANATAQRLASQVGQKLVDNFGDVHTVVDIYFDPADPNPDVDAVIVSPPFRPDAVRAVVTGTGGPASFVEMVFTPQIPASASIVTITP